MGPNTNLQTYLKTAIFYTLVLLTFAATSVIGSLGDQMIEYKLYQHECIKLNCSSHLLARFNERHPLYLRLLGWDCIAECQYQSQWTILRELKQLQIPVVPQFHGKWTFHRLFGIQEPASFIFSGMNLWSNYRALMDYNKLVLNRDPMSSMYRFQAYFAMNAWVWSMVYHARESKMTEYLDYFFAYSVALFSLYEAFVKWLIEIGVNVSMRWLLNISVPFFAMYCYHFYFLFFVHFDYLYNMKVNITTGAISTLMWLTWCMFHQKNRPHVWKCGLTFVLLNVFVMLELFDFPPIFNIFDAHSLWHATTIPLPFLWFSFARDEAHFRQIPDKFKLM